MSATNRDLKLGTSVRLSGIARRCPGIACASLLDLTSQTPSANITVSMGGSTKFKGWLSKKNGFLNLAAHVGETKIAATVPVGQIGVVQPEQM